MIKIALFENPPKENNVLYTFISSKGYQIDHYTDLKILDSNSVFNLIIIDIDTFGPNVCRSFTKLNEKNIPILPLISNHNITVLIDCFSSGHHHYIKKPYELKEFELHLNRLYPSLHIKDIHSNNRYFFDEKRSTLSYYDKNYIFTKNEASLISLFMKKKNQIIPEQEISEYIWKSSHCKSATIRALITKTQKKLPHKFIKNFRGVGYMWIDTIILDTGLEIT
jgi:DNA-binding response OmpR family regulator